MLSAKELILLIVHFFPQVFFFSYRIVMWAYFVRKQRGTKHITEQQQAASSFSIGFTMASHMSPPLTLLSKIARFSRNGQMHLQMDFS